MKKRVVVAGQMVDPAAFEVLRSETEVIDATGFDRERLEAAVADAHGYYCTAASGALLERSPRLEVLGFPGSGYDSIDVAAATNLGIALVFAAGSQYAAVAEHALGLMLSLSKRIAISDRRMHETRKFIPRHVFFGDGWPGFPQEIDGKTLGIMGFGFIGRDLANKCRLGFKMKVLAYDPYSDPLEAERLGVRLYRRRSELITMISQVDFLVLSLLLTPETRGIIGTAELNAMKPSSWLINVSRGGTLDEPALIAHLAAGRIAGAGIDVFDSEPTADNHPFYSMDNVVVTPHIGGWVREAMPRLARNAANDMLAVLRGERPVRFANPAVWDAPNRRARGAGA